MKIVTSTLLLCAMLCAHSLHAQCPTGKIETTITVRTDGFGYEMYWQLIPAGNNCGTGTIFAGGNSAVGCNGGGDKVQPQGGYGDFQTITEGPWCLDENASYTIFHVDDWADGGTKFDVNIGGLPVNQFQGQTTDESFTFTAENPPALDVAITAINTSAFVSAGQVNVEGSLKNMGTSTITSVDVSYNVDGGTSVTETVSGLSVAPFATYYLTHPTPLNVTMQGSFTLQVELSNPNGQGPDEEPANNVLSKSITVKQPIRDIMSWYTEPGNHMEFATIGDSAHQTVVVPRDLDFSPIGELWIINKETENSGGTTVTIRNPGKPNQSSEWLQDGNAWHFMSLPTAIAFSNNGNFATSPGVFDANHNGSSPFTGPTLWDSNPAVYAQESGGNGSHIDMLHESPEAMGIASESENKFWLFDSYSNDIVYYDFKADHGPGNDDHSDGVIRRFKGMSVERINEHIVCHLVYDLNSGWLYIVDGANRRVLRLDTKSGTPGGTPSFTATEALAEYVDVTGATWETVVDTGLVQPAGIDLLGNHLIVSDYSNGDIIIYDITSIPATEEARIPTGSPGVMGLVVGPDGRIWYVNADDNKVMRIEPDSVPEIIDTSHVGINPIENNLSVTVYPVPANDEINIVCSNCDNGKYEVAVFNILGAEVFKSPIIEKRVSINSANWPTGIYTALVKGDKGRYVRKVMVE